MPAESKKQQKFFGILKSIRDGTADPGKIDNYKELKEKAGSEIYAATFSKDIAEQLTKYQIDHILHVNSEKLIEYRC